ncbi:MAG: metallophosphoesterase [Olsenella sp.]|nr:metallophosphoesterase [Olsenella sp.]
MTVYVTGDLHGGADIASLREWDGAVGSGLGEQDFLVVAGDFGYPWSRSGHERADVRWLESRPYGVLFVDGNHERYDHWAKRPYEKWHGGLTQTLRDGSPIRRLCRGEVFDLCGDRVLALGGARSVDRFWRNPYKDWWPDEMPSKECLADARARLDEANWEVDYVVTHTCATRLLPATLRPDRGWENPDADRLTDFFDELEERLSFRHWYFGHFHRDRDVDNRHTVLYDRVVRLGDGVGRA